MTSTATHRATRTTARTLPAVLILCATALAFLFATVSSADAATVAESSRTDRTPVCVAEDSPPAGASRCVWDARHHGNGEGRSFVLLRVGDDDPTVRTVTHRRAHWLATTAN